MSLAKLDYEPSTLQVKTYPVYGTGVFAAILLAGAIILGSLFLNASGCSVLP